MSERKFMFRCIELGRLALAQMESPVGSILVYQDEIIGEGIEAVHTDDDATFHAEILAVKDAIAQGHKSKLAEAIMYTTHEPCIMCSYVIRTHKIPKIIYGMKIDHIGGAQYGVLQTEEVPYWGSAPQSIQSEFSEECLALHQEYLALKTNK